LEVIATLSVVENSDQIISRLGSIVVIIELLKKHSGNVELLEDAITTLALMSKRTRHRRAIGQNAGVKELVNLLKQYIGKPALVIAVCRFLNNFAVKEEYCLTVLSNGGIEALTAAFNQPVEGGGLTAADTRATVASAIWVCSTDCNDAQTTLLSAGFLKSIAAVLEKHRDHVGLLEASLGIVRLLCRHAAHREEILKLGFVKMAAEAMKNFPDSTGLQKEACGIFGNLATDPNIREQLGDVGALQEVVTTLGRCRANDDRKLAKLALMALMNLSSSEANRELLAHTEVVPNILRAAQTFMHNENILEYAVGVISHISVQSVCGRALIEAGAVEALLLFLREHKEDLQVITRSLVALRRLVKTSAASGDEAADMALIQHIACAGNREGGAGIKLLVEAMEAHVYDETVCKETALLFTSLCKVQSSIPLLMAHAVQPCIKAIEVHQNDPLAADALAGLVALLPLEDDEQWSKGPDASPKPRSDVLLGFGVAAQVPRTAKPAMSGGYS